MGRGPFDVRDSGRVERHRSKHQTLLVVVLAQYLVIAQVEFVTDAKPVNIRNALEFMISWGLLLAKFMYHT